MASIRLQSANASKALKEKFAKNSSSKTTPPKFEKSSAPASDRWKDRRQSKNITDLRQPSEQTKQRIGEKHERMIFRPDVEKQMVKYGNKAHGKSKGGEALKAPAPKKVQYNIFSKKKGH